MRSLARHALFVLLLALLPAGAALAQAPETIQVPLVLEKRLTVPAREFLSFGSGLTVELLKDSRLAGLANETVRRAICGSEIVPVPLTLQVKDRSGKVTQTLVQGGALGTMQLVDIYGDGRPALVLTIDYSGCPGTSLGTESQFFEVRDGKLQPVMVTVPGSEPRPLMLATSLRADWQYVRRGSGNHILVVSSAPEGDPYEPDDLFVTFYDRLRPGSGGVWVRDRRVAPGAWNAAEGFPPVSVFP